MKQTDHNFTKYITLNVLGMLGLSGYILADTFFVSNRLGSQGLAALNLAISVFGLINGIGMMLGIGAATRYSICKAQNNHSKANQVYTIAITSGITIGIAFTLVGLLFSNELAQLLGADPETLSMCAVYLKTALSFSPFFILNHILIAFMRNDGNPKLSMAAMLVGSLSNIVLDYLFIYPFQWGMFGAAFATGLAPVIGLSVSSIHFFTKKNGFHFTRTKVSYKDLTDISGLGSAAFVNEFSSGVVLVVFNLLLMAFAGSLGVAAYGIIANLGLVSVAVFTGISQGIQPLISQAYGKNDMQTVKKIYQKAIFLGAVIGLLIYLMMLLFPSSIVSIFNREQDLQLQRMAEDGLRIYFIGFLFTGYNILTTSLLGAIAQPKASFFLSFFRGCIGIVAFVVLLAWMFGLYGVWLAFPIVEFLTMIIGITISRRIFQK